MSAKDASRYEAKQGKPRDYAEEFGRKIAGDYTDGAEQLDEVDFAGKETRPKSPSAKVKAIASKAKDSSLSLAAIRGGEAVSSFGPKAPKSKKTQEQADVDVDHAEEGDSDGFPTKKNPIDIEGGVAYEVDSLEFLEFDEDEKDKPGLKEKLAHQATSALANKIKNEAKKLEKAVEKEALDGLDDRSTDAETAEFVARHSKNAAKNVANKTYSTIRKTVSSTRTAATPAGRMAAARSAPAPAASIATAGAKAKAAAAAAVPKSPAGLIVVIGAVILIVVGMFSFTMCSGVFGDDDGDAGSANLKGLAAHEASVARWLLDEGFSIESTAAIMGNIANEGGFDPDRWEVNNDGVAYNPYERAFGMFQYTSILPGTGLYHRFKTWCSENGKDPFEHESSLEFTFTHETGGYFGSLWYMSLASNGYYANCPGYDRVDGGPYTADEFKDADDVGRATYSWMSCYERCANGQYAHLDRRLDSAEAYYEILRRDAAGGGSIASVGDLIWPSATPQWLTYSGHFGLDIQSMYGTPIYAPADGVVMWAGWSWESTYGNIVRIDHDGLGLQTACAHMSRVLVESGDKVEQGDVIGYTGSTGNSSGPHIHFEIYERDDGLRLGYPIMDDMNKWGLYFDRKALESNRVG